MTGTIYPSLANKVIVITGGASGIGAALVEQFALQGAQVVFLDIDDNAAQILLRTPLILQHDLDYRRVDVTNTSLLQQTIEDIGTQFGTLDVLINNVANDDRHDPLAINKQYWHESLAVNLDTHFFSSQSAIKIMRDHQSGVIINVSSINALLGPSNMPAYVAAKSALLGLTKSLANQYGSLGIRVNCIVPGWVATEKQLNSWLTPEAEQDWNRQLALTARIEPVDIAHLALFLAADNSAKITGQHFVIDAGRS